MLEFVILSENRDGNLCEGESGLSIYVKYNDNCFLFDTGYSSLFKSNAQKLNIDISNVSTVVLSHGHSDHTNGIPYLEHGKTIIIHPEGFKERYSIRKKEYAGFPMSINEVKEKHNLILSKEPIEFIPNIFFLGEIQMNLDFEASGNFSTTLDKELTKTDYTEDDSGIVIKTNKGLIIFTGCGHRGICNTIEKAISITNEHRIHSVLGGFHLRNLDEKKETIDLTIEYLKKVGVKNLYLGHCITDQVIDYFENNMKDTKIIRLYSGASYKINI